MDRNLDDQILVVRKKMVVMDESFICVALTSINIMLSSLWSMTKVFLGNSTVSHPFAEHTTTINYFEQKEDTKVLTY